MVERVTFRLSKKSYPAYAALKEWCRVNRVPMGRILNATVQAMQLVDYNQVGSPKHCVIDIQYPMQTDLDDVIRYRRYKSLTRVKV